MAEEEKSEPKKTRWIPLESNPNVCNKYAEGLGLNTQEYSFYELMSVEDWAIGMLPQPVLAILLLFPISEASEKVKSEQNERITANGQEMPEDVFFLKQTIGNACGTIGMIHALANISRENLTGAPIALDPEKFLAKYVESTSGMTPEARGHELEHGELAKMIDREHSSAASEGQSHIDMNVRTHFLAIVPLNGNLIELDGRKAFPINHGPIQSPETFALEACERVVQEEFMKKDPEEIRFSMMAIVKGPPADD